ncbi:MAG: hypothetical protein C4321_08200, partial [Chloroflexota bacterium]
GHEEPGMGMIAELEPIWKQLNETYESLRHALAHVPEERLNWQPGPTTNSVSVIVQHIVRANLRYASFLGGPDPGLQHRRREDLATPEHAGERRERARLDDSERSLKATLERVTPDALRAIHAGEWYPLDSHAVGPLDGFWFVLQMVRHSAYHLGQINLYLLLIEGETAA